MNNQKTENLEVEEKFHSKETNDEVAETEEHLAGTVAELSDLSASMVENIHATLEKKRGKNDSRINIVLEKINTLAEVGTGFKMKGWVNSFVKLLGTAKKINPKLVIPEGIATLQEKVATTADIIDDAPAALQVLGGEGGQMLQNTGDSMIDTALSKFDQEMQKVKQKKDITHSAYINAFEHSLQQFLTEIQLPSMPLSSNSSEDKSDLIPAELSPVASSVVVTPPQLQESENNIDKTDEKISQRMEKVKQGYTAVCEKYSTLQGKGNFENKNVALVDPQKRSLIVDPKTQTLFYVIDGKIDKTIQVALGQGKDKQGRIDATADSWMTPPGNLVVLDPKIMNDGSGRPALILDGLDDGNKNTDDRAVLMHPTKSGKTSGNPTSQGCITMSNENYSFFAEELAKGTMIHVIAEDYDKEYTKYFATNVQGKIENVNLA